MALDLFSVGTSAKTLNATDFELDNQVSVTESHTRYISRAAVSNQDVGFDGWRL